MPRSFNRRVAAGRVKIPSRGTHSMGSKSGHHLRIERLASHSVIHEHPRTRCWSLGKGRLPKLGYKVEVISDLAQSGAESPVVELIPSDSVRHRHVTEAQLLAGIGRPHLGSKMCRFCKICAWASKANYLGIPGKDQRTRDGRIQTSAIDVESSLVFIPLRNFRSRASSSSSNAAAVRASVQASTRRGCPSKLAASLAAFSLRTVSAMESNVRRAP